MQLNLSRDIITAAVGPVVIMSACGLLCSTFYTRMTNVITRLRAFQRERLTEQKLLARETDELTKKAQRELLSILGQQTNILVRRVKYLRTTLYCLLCTILSLALCSLFLGLTIIAQPLINVAIGFFVLGILLLITGIVFAILDLRMALAPVVLETDFVSRRIDAGEGV